MQLVYACNICTQEAEAGRSEVGDQPGQLKDTLCQTKILKGGVAGDVALW